jgi:hypothetical protein
MGFSEAVWTCAPANPWYKQFIITRSYSEAMREGNKE